MSESIENNPLQGLASDKQTDNKQIENDNPQGLKNEKQQGLKNENQQGSKNDTKSLLNHKTSKHMKRIDVAIVFKNNEYKQFTLQTSSDVVKFITMLCNALRETGDINSFILATKTSSYDYTFVI